MNPFLTRELAAEHIRDIREEAGRTGRRHAEAPANEGDQDTDVTIRRFAEHDIDGIRRLAALDEKPVPAGAVLVAEVRGELVAALPLDGGPALADPFKPTADIAALLRLRARQSRRSSGARRFHLPLPATSSP